MCDKKAGTDYYKKEKQKLVRCNYLSNLDTFIYNIREPSYIKGFRVNFPNADDWHKSPYRDFFSLGSRNLMFKKVLTNLDSLLIIFVFIIIIK